MDIVHQVWRPVVSSKKGHNQPTLRTTQDDDSVSIKNVNPIIQDAIRSGRLSKKMSTSDLASLLEITPELVQKFENGKAFPSAKILIQLEEILDFTV